MEKVIAYKSSNGHLFDTEEKCVAYGVFFHLPSDLKHRMHNASEWQDEPIANIMISVIKDMGVYKNIK